MLLDPAVSVSRHYQALWWEGLGAGLVILPGMLRTLLVTNILFNLYTFSDVITSPLWTSVSLFVEWLKFNGFLESLWL